MLHAATHCNTVQHTATHCNTLQHTATHHHADAATREACSLHYAATQCNTLHHATTRCNIPSCRCCHTARVLSANHCNTLQLTATHCNTLQHIATHCNTPQHTATYRHADATTRQGCETHAADTREACPPPPCARPVTSQRADVCVCVHVCLHAHRHVSLSLLVCPHPPHCSPRFHLLLRVYPLSLSPSLCWVRYQNESWPCHPRCFADNCWPYLCCSVLQCVVCVCACKQLWLCVAVCCSVSQCVVCIYVCNESQPCHPRCFADNYWPCLCCSVLQCAAVYYSVLYVCMHVKIYGPVLRCVAERCMYVCM